MNKQGYCYSLLLVPSLLSIGCSKSNLYTFTAVQPQSVKNYSPGFKEYCELDLSTNFELNAVQCSFYGDYKNALDQATKREDIRNNPRSSIAINGDSLDNAGQLKRLNAELKDPNVSEERKTFINQIINILSIPATEVVFNNAKPIPAINHIVEKAKVYHYTLINEAHFNSQHRSFTKDLLKPLWNEGYRYLALEALGYKDTELFKRGYPLLSTGYYIKDSNFGNLVRYALKIGYQLVAYESQSPNDGTLRDRDQATNIIKQTWEKDKKGKVLIHAGYSHISELGGANYEPMGYQLKRLSGQDILTIDQTLMVGFNDSTKLHPYYKEATKKFEFTEPTVFLGNSKIIADPIISGGIDIQVYHPMTRFELGRPQWMKNETTKQIDLTYQINTYSGCLIQAVRYDDVKEAVPIDQFVIGNASALLLPSGRYELRIINREGILVGISRLKVR